MVALALVVQSLHAPVLTPSGAATIDEKLELLRERGSTLEPEVSPVFRTLSP